MISVIVPAWNDEKRIGPCIEGLVGQSLPAEAFEIIVVDNGSTDATAAVAAGYPGVVVLSEPRPGSYAARNTGLARAKGQYVAFTDSDCVPEPGWLKAGLAAVRSGADIGVAAGRVLFQEPTGAHSRAGLNYERQLSMRQDENVAKGYAITANWFAARAVLLEAGGFDANLKSGGDHKLSAQLHKAGRRIVYVPDAVVQHPPRAQVGEIVRKARRVVGGKWASASGRFRSLARLKVETRNFIERARAISRARELSLWERCEVIGLLLRIWIVSFVELARLQLGGEPARS